MYCNFKKLIKININQTLITNLIIFTVKTIKNQQKHKKIIQNWKKIYLIKLLIKNLIISTCKTIKNQQKQIKIFKFKK